MTPEDWFYVLLSRFISFLGVNSSLSANQLQQTDMCKVIKKQFEIVVLQIRKYAIERQKRFPRYRLSIATSARDS